MEFIWIITSECAQRRFFCGKNLDYAFIFKHEDNTIVLELEDNDDLCKSFTIKTCTATDHEKAYDRVCDAIIRNTNFIDLRGLECKVFDDQEEL